MARDDMEFDSIEFAIDTFRGGKLLMVMDAHDRENECDFMVSALMVSKEQMAFVIRKSTGIVCISTDKERLERIGLHPATPKNTDSNQTPFYVSTDYISGTTTGVSASDRVATARAFTDDNLGSVDFSKPGHMFPLCSKPHGLLERKGHTEAAYDLCRLSGLPTVAVIAELMDENGDMMRYKQCRQFSLQHGIPLISVEMILENMKKKSLYINIRTEEVPFYDGTSDDTVDNDAPFICPETNGGIVKSQQYNKIRTENEYILPMCSISLSGFKKLPTIQIFRVSEHLEVVAMTTGEVSGQYKVFTRIHSECFTGDVLGSTSCDCGEQLSAFLADMSQAENGILLYMKGHEGRGIGLANKIRSYNIQQALGLDTIDANIRLGLPVDSRQYHSLRDILLKDLGVRSIVLCTNNPDKVAALEGIVEGLVPSTVIPTETNIKYIRTKQQRMNHTIPRDEDIRGGGKV